ncbi:MAG: hypothetical protein HGA22_03805 [Clostridiales bacterium]|nr:hypothetical protein [Clostridiales bacterium]
MMKSTKNLAMFIPICAMLFLSACGSRYSAHYKIRPILSADEYDAVPAEQFTLAQCADFLANKFKTIEGGDVSASVDGDCVVLNAVVSAPPVNFDRIVSMTGGFSLNMVDDAYTKRAMEWAQIYISEKRLKGADRSERKKIEKEIARAVNLPDTMMIRYYYMMNKETRKIEPQYPVALLRSPFLRDTDFAYAKISTDQFGKSAIGAETTKTGADKFAEATSAKYFGKRLAIVHDGQVRLMPVIQTQILNGKIQISGDFTEQELASLVVILKTGGFPFRVEIVEKSFVARK